MSKAKLGNLRHEKFAQLVAGGMRQGAAYEEAGFKRSKSGASHLRKRPDVAARIDQLKAGRFLPSLTEEEGAQGLARLGVTRDWIARQYFEIHKSAFSAGKMADSTRAVERLQKMREEEDRAMEAKSASAPSENKIDINALGVVLDKFAGVLEAAKQPAQSMVDITPPLADQKAHRAALAAEK